MNEKERSPERPKKKRSTETRKTFFERGSKFGRDFNLLVGSVALAGAFVAPPILAAGLGIYAGVNFAQAGGFEVARRYAKKRSAKKNEKHSGK